MDIIETIDQAFIYILIGFMAIFAISIPIAIGVLLYVIYLDMGLYFLLIPLFICICLIVGYVVCKIQGD